jgi:hypothetical protein
MKNPLFPLRGAVVLVSLLLSVSAMAVDRINVTDYGAVPNDGISDNTAINNAVASGRSIYFPPGTYNYTGSITLPANQSYRLYGDGPGVSTIVFNGNPYAGIYGPNMGTEKLTVEGLTLQGNTTACGTGIYVLFGPHTGNDKVHTATIQNVQIVGSARDGTSGGYWTGGIYLLRAQNAVIDNVEVAGNKNVTDFGLMWDSPYNQATTGLNASNLQFKWCNSAFRTGGHVEGIYMTGFDFFSCGRNNSYAVEFTNNVGDYPNYLRPGTAHLVNGKIDSVGGGLRTSFLWTKVSNVRFNHTGPEAADATLLYIDGQNAPNGVTGSTDIMVTECSFYGVSPGTVANENGIFASNARFLRFAGNNFTHMQPTNGSCIVVLGSTVIRVTDNVFDDVRNAYYVSGEMPYFEGNNR